MKKRKDQKMKKTKNKKQVRKKHAKEFKNIKKSFEGFQEKIEINYNKPMKIT